MVTQLPSHMKGAQPPISAHVYCGQTVAHLSYCWPVVKCRLYLSLLQVSYTQDTASDSAFGAWYKLQAICLLTVNYAPLGGLYYVQSDDVTRWHLMGFHSVELSYFSVCKVCHSFHVGPIVSSGIICSLIGTTFCLVFYFSTVYTCDTIHYQAYLQSYWVRYMKSCGSVTKSGKKSSLALQNSYVT